jgi:hypothetical protein
LHSILPFMPLLLVCPGIKPSDFLAEYNDKSIDALDSCLSRPCCSTRNPTIHSPRGPELAQICYPCTSTA